MKKKGALESKLSNYSKSCDWNDEIFDLNLIVSLDKVGRNKLLAELIKNQWQDKTGKFVNLHYVYGDLRILIFAYVDVINVKKAT